MAALGDGSHDVQCDYTNPRLLPSSGSSTHTSGSSSSGTDSSSSSSSYGEGNGELRIVESSDMHPRTDDDSESGTMHRSGTWKEQRPRIGQDEMGGGRMPAFRLHHLEPDPDDSGCSDTDVDDDVPSLVSIHRPPSSSIMSKAANSAFAPVRTLQAMVPPAMSLMSLSERLQSGNAPGIGSPLLASSGQAVVLTSSNSGRSTVSTEQASSAGTTQQLDDNGICEVCNDEAHGRHFGVLTCEACKSFFRRSVRKKSKYICAREMKCVVNNLRRTVCQYCRFKKCLRKGMKPELVQDARCPQRLSQVQMVRSPRHATSSSSSLTFHTVPNRQSKAEVADVQEEVGPPPPVVHLPPLLNVHVSPTKLASMVPISEPALSKALHAADRERRVGANQPVGNSWKLVDYLVAADQRAADDFSTHNFSDGTLRISFAEDHIEVRQFFEELLVLAVKWAKLIPQFEALPSQEDQAKVLAPCWVNLVVYKLAMQSQPNLSSMILGHTRALRRSKGQNPELAEVVDVLLDSAIKPLVALHMCRMEKACLGGLILFQPDSQLCNGSSESTYSALSMHHDLLLYALVDIAAVYKSAIQRVCPEQRFLSVLGDMTNAATTLRCYLSRHHSLFGNGDELIQFIMLALRDGEDGEGEEMEVAAEGLYSEDEDVDVV